jgi:hypothetical protein
MLRIRQKAVHRKKNGKQAQKATQNDPQAFFLFNHTNPLLSYGCAHSRNAFHYHCMVSNIEINYLSASATMAF